MFHPDLHEHDPEKRKTYELLTQAINEARDCGDIELLELIAKDPQAFILKQGWASVSLDVSRGLMELRSLYEHLQARILEMIEPSPLALRRAKDAGRGAGERGLRGVSSCGGRRVGDRADRFRAAGGVGAGDRGIEGGGGENCGGGEGIGGGGAVLRTTRSETLLARSAARRHSHELAGEVLAHEPNPSRCFGLDAKSPSPLRSLPHRSALRSNRLGGVLSRDDLELFLQGLAKQCRAAGPLGARHRIHPGNQLVGNFQGNGCHAWKVLPNPQIGNTGVTRPIGGKCRFKRKSLPAGVPAREADFSNRLRGWVERAAGFHRRRRGRGRS